MAQATSQATRGPPLRRNQGATSSSAPTAGMTQHQQQQQQQRQQQRRRLDDSEANWMDADSSTEADTDDDMYSEDEEEPQRTLQPQRGNHRIRTNTSSASISSSSTLYESVAGVGTDRDRAGGHSKYAPSGSGKSLTPYSTNDWKSKGDSYNEKQHHPFYTGHTNTYPRSRRRSRDASCCDDVMEVNSVGDCLKVVWSRATIRVAFGWLCAGLLLWTFSWWFGGAADKMASNTQLRASVHLKMSGALPRQMRGRYRQWFGSQDPLEFHGLQQIGRLNETDWRWEEGRRLVIVGDVHGCADPLEALLKKVKFDGDRDHLAFTGDLVAKGPETPRVLDIAMRHNASCVRGNHEDRLLLLYRDLQAPLRAVQRRPDDGDGSQITGQAGHTKERDLAAVLTRDHVSYLQSCPLILDLGALPGAAPRALLAHAGLTPGLALDRQDPYSVMNMRSVDIRTHTPVRAHDPATARELRARRPEQASDLGPGRDDLPPPWDAKARRRQSVFDLDEKYVLPWRQLWEQYQASLPAAADRTLLVYGHDSLVGVRDGTWAVGLDGGCVAGNTLNALVLEMKGGTVRRRIESVSCADMAAKKKKKGKGGKRGKGKD